jgi:hypothetical protein
MFYDQSLGALNGRTVPGTGNISRARRMTFLIRRAPPYQSRTLWNFAVTGWNFAPAASVSQRDHYTAEWGSCQGVHVR